MKIVLTVSELRAKDCLLDALDLVGISQWAINEGQLGSEDELTLTPEQAVSLGLIEEGERW